MAQIIGTEGDNTLNGTIFRDTIEGLGGDDFINARDADDTLFGNDGDDEIWAGDGEDSLYGGDDDDTLVGESGFDDLFGGDGNDQLYGGSGIDDLYGGAGNDEVVFSWEDDSIDGGDGDDLLAARPLDRAGASYLPLISGGAGEDTLVFEPQIGPDNARSLMADLSIGAAWFSYTFTRYDILLSFIDTNEIFYSALSGIENLEGTTGDDSLTGDNGENELSGGDGNDALFGGGGDDELLDGNIEGDTRTQDDLFGGAGNDQIRTVNGADQIFGDSGNDTIWVADPAAADVNGGTDTDTLYIAGVNASADHYVLGGAGNYTGIEIFRFGATNYSVAPYSGDLDLVLDASLGAGLHDGTLTVATGNGDDHLNASNVADSVKVVLEGGAGDDVFVNVASANIFGGDVFEGGSGIDRLDLDEYLASWGGPAVLVGENNTVTGVEIINLHGSLTTSGINLIDLAIPLANTSSTGNLTVNGYGLAQDFIDGSRIANSAVSLFLNGAGGNDHLTGGAGADMLNGGTGGDTMAGGSGDDTYIVDSLTDTATENLLAGTSDGVIASVDFTLGANIEELALSGTADIDGIGNGIANQISGNSGRNTLSGLGGIDHLYGDAGDDDLFGGQGNDTLQGGSENDELDGGTGADIMEGGAGDDIYIVDDAGDAVTEINNQGSSDLVMTSVSQVLSFFVENLLLFGTDNIYGVGNGLDNMIVGNGGSNALTGLAGADSIFGYGGADFLLGGTGGDGLDGGAGSDTALYTGSAAVAINLAAQSYLGGDATGDTLTSIENVTGSGFADSLIGDAAANILAGGAGEDQLTGLAGADTLFGGDNNDIITGNDFGVAFNFLDTLYGGGGDDNLYVGIGGSAIQNGDAGNDTLYGFSGVDTLRGGLDDDFIYGAAGDDLFQFNTADFANGDSDIVYFVDAGDRLQFSSGMNGSLYFQDLASLEYAPGQFTTGVYITAFLDGGETAAVTVYGTTVASLTPMVEYTL